MSEFLDRQEGLAKALVIQLVEQQEHIMALGKSYDDFIA